MTLHVDDRGARRAPTVVFLHGLGVSGWMWDEQVDALGADHRCLVVDLPGNGASAHVPWRSMSDAARQVADTVRDHVGRERVHVVGLSLGGHVALHLLADQPALIASAIASGVTTRPLDRAWRYRLLARAAAPLLRFPPAVSVSAQAMQLPPDAAAAYRRDARVLTPRTVRAIYDELLGSHVPPAVADRAADLLMVAGSREVRAIRDDTAGLTDQVPGATAALVAGAEHAWNATRPELFSAMIAAWIDGRRRAPGLVDAASYASARIRSGSSPTRSHHSR